MSTAGGITYRKHTPIAKASRRERKIERLSLELERDAGIFPRIMNMANECENAFLYRLLDKRPGAKVARNGWPDFLVEQADGTIVGVEVKSGTDRLRKDQVRMFSMLERTGLAIFVWTEVAPDRLIPWRKFHTARSEAIRKRAA